RHRDVDHGRAGDRPQLLGSPSAPDGALRRWAARDLRRDRTGSARSRAWANSEHVRATVVDESRGDDDRAQFAAPPAGRAIRRRFPAREPRQALAGGPQDRLGWVLRTRAAPARAVADLPLRAP